MKRTAALVVALALLGCGRSGSSTGYETASLGSSRHALAVSTTNPAASRALAQAAVTERPASIAPTTSLAPGQARALAGLFRSAAHASQNAPCHVSAVAATGGAVGGMSWTGSSGPATQTTATTTTPASTAARTRALSGSALTASTLTASSVWNRLLDPRLLQAITAPAPLPDTTPQAHDTSEFMAGKVAVRLVLVDGPGHSFSDGDAAAALADVTEAMDLWVRELPQSKLSFVYQVDRVSVSVDAIELPTDQRYGWMQEAENQLLGSAATGNVNEDAYELDRRARAAYGTDWAVTYFTIRAADGLGELVSGKATFPDGWGAYTMLGGPYGIYPYSRVWGAHFWNAPIFAHEFAHFFYALDEYSKYHDMGHTSSEQTGYLDVTNPNLAGDPTSTMDEHCLMRGSFWAVMDYIADHLWELVTFGGFHWDYNICSSSLAQIAATPTASGRTPPTDVRPVIQGQVARQGADVQLTGQAGAGALPNKNPYDNTVHPASERKDLSIDPLQVVHVKCACGPWQELTVPAGARLVDLTTTFPNLVSGEVVVVEAVSASGLVTSQTFTAP